MLSPRGEGEIVSWFLTFNYWELNPAESRSLARCTERI